MATISSPGLASGIDVKSIVVATGGARSSAAAAAADEPPARCKSQLSVYGSLKSMVSSLGDAAAKLSTASGWSGVKASIIQRRPR